MNVITNIVTSRLWIKGCDGITFEGHSDWRFYYSIQGTETKLWHVIFYQPSSNRMYIRSPVISLKVKNVILQTYSYLSNVYRLILEYTDKRLDKWSPDAYKPTINLPTGIVAAATSQVYRCTPPIMFRDSFSTLNLKQTQHAPIGGRDVISITSGYVVYKGDPVNHSGHFPKTWIPAVYVDSGTFDITFEVVYNTPRRRGECLECQCPRGRLWSSDVANLLVNH